MLGYDKERSLFTWDEVPFTLTSEQERTARAVRWYQKIQLTPDFETQGVDPVYQKLPKYAVDNAQFAGLDVLIAGAHEGFFLNYAQAFGARRAVGLADTFNCFPSLLPARKFLNTFLRSRVEFIERSIYDLTPERDGQFDIVMLHDVLPHLRHPLYAIDRLAAMVRSVFVLSVPYLLTTEPMPAAVLGWQHSHDERDSTIPNLAWIQRAVESAGMKLHQLMVHEPDSVSIIASHQDTSIGEAPPLASLPDDRGMEDRTAILVASCEKYRACWEPFFVLFRRYWPDCPYKVFFGTDRGSVPAEWATTIELGEDHHWAGNTKRFLEQIPADRIMMFQEDFFLERPVDTEAVRRLVRHAHEHDAAMLRFRAIPQPTGRWPHCDRLGTLGVFDDFRASFQLSIWDKRSYDAILVDGESPWTTEFMGGRRLTLSPKPFLSIWNDVETPIMYLAYAVERGEWTDLALQLLKKEGFDTESWVKKIA